MKYNFNSSIKRYKARLIAKIFSQIYGIDFTKTFAPTIRCKLVKIFLAIATLLKITFIQIDVISAYLERILKQNK